MDWLQVGNLKSTYLAGSGIDADDTSATVVDGLFGPGTALGVPCELWIWGAAFDTPALDPDRECVLCTDITGDVLTIVRAQEGTTASAHDAGANIANLVSAGVIQELQGQVDAHDHTGGEGARIPLAGMADIAPDTIIGSIITPATAPQALTAPEVRGLLGLATTDTPTFAGQNLQLASDTAGTIPFQSVYKARGTLASPTALQLNDYVGAFYARGYAGATTGYALRAGLLFYCSGAPDDGTGSMPISAIMQTGTTAQVSRQYWLADGKVGIGAVPTVGFDVAMQTYIYSGTYPALRVDRTGSGTNTVLTAFEVRQRTTGNMADGFGAELAFSIQDDAAANNLLATIAAIRAGADNTGDLYLRVRAAGVSKDAAIIRSTGIIEAKYAMQVATGFGCNSKTPQTAYASGGAVTTGAGAYGFASDAERIAVTALLTNIRAALVANGIMS